MFANQKLTDAEIDVLLVKGWKLMDFRGAVPRFIWNSLIETYTSIDKEKFKIVCDNETIDGIMGVIIISPEMAGQK